jgi:hypothetical protein
MNPLFTTITQDEFEKNIDFIVTLVQRGNGFYIKTEGDKLVALIPINDPVMQSLVSGSDLSSEIDEAIKEFSES